MSVQVYLSIGSNLGDRDAHLRAAVELLARLPSSEVVAVSPFVDTAPWGNEDQPAFRNGVVELRTGLAPTELLAHAKRIEAEVGRTSTYRWGPRVIDVDIVTYGTWIVDLPELTIPHRHAHERAFVLDPLRGLSPEAADLIAARQWATKRWSSG